MKMMTKGGGDNKGGRRRGSKIKRRQRALRSRETAFARKFNGWRNKGGGDRFKKKED